MVVFTSCKINLGLNILSRRTDGYHNLSTLMIPVDWSDIIEIVPARGSDTTLTVLGRNVDCPPEKNLVMRAYRALEAITPLPPVDIYLEKIVPDGAGLGGGSADASF
ncbi:MAG: 4-(cytidine 5'-diphospho)-2-C-methyl-D-erythritol kinase, partial [Muribaculaceae bacterium]|nr:4-(cytidine 5'-diphospho)-2-C-methyl-D-erythritol kinase [Muribaculaceae bacterium]